MTAADPTADAGLFHVEAPPPVSLADRFVVPPFSVLDRRQGIWTDRKRRWLSLGIESDLGRGAELTYTFGAGFMRDQGLKLVSVFDPVICELVYRWFSRPGADVLDPYAGGSVRGIVAGILGRRYTGIDLSETQLAANEAQRLRILPDAPVAWLHGDATRLDDALDWDAEYDLVFSCPPYGDLEVYSDDPRDISTWTYPAFLEGHAASISQACERLRDNRFAAWVVSDIRDNGGLYRGFTYATYDAFIAAGLRLVNECIMLDPLASAPARAGRPFEANRKVTRTHQILYIFVKGDVKQAARWAAGTNGHEVGEL